MATDNRPGTPNSGSATIASGDGGTDVTTVLNNRDDALFSLEKVVITYPPGSANTQVQFFDDPDGTADGDLSSAILTVDVATGADEPFVLDLDDLEMQDIENDVLVEPDGSQDSDVQVYVGGENVTSAAVQ